MTALFRTVRLQVRPWRPGDAAVAAALRGDPDVVRAMGWSSDPAAVARLLTDAAGRTPTDGRGWINLAVVAASDGAVLGDHGVCVEGADARVGLAFLPAARRRGFGAELIAGSAAWLAARGVRRLIAEIDADNAPSLALFAALGFALEAEARDAKGPYRILARPADTPFAPRRRGL